MPDDGHAAGDTRSVPVWLNVRENIQQDLRANMFAPGAMLPTMKELAGRYGSSFRTIRRALHSLALDGRLVPYGRRFQVFRPASAPGSRTVVMITDNPEIGEIVHYTPRAQEFLLMLRKECAARHVGMRLESWESLTAAALASIERNIDPLGYVIWDTGMPEEHFSDLHDRIRQVVKPVVVLDELGFYLDTRLSRLDGRFRVIPVGVTEAPGVDMGNYLLGLGHADIVCINTAQTDRYLNRRIDGIRKVYERAGMAGRVRARFCMRPEDAAAAPPAIGEEPFPELYRRMQAFDDLLNAPPYGDFPLYAGLGKLFKSRYLQAALQPLFESLYRTDRHATWVCLTDMIGLFAVHFLRSKEDWVPNHPAVAGFDDTLEAMAVELTSYNFNMPGVVTAMFDHLFLPLSTIKKQRHQAGTILEIPGMVMARRSCGRRAR